MRAEYDSQADAVGVWHTSDQDPRAEYADEISDLVNVAVDAAGRAVALEVLGARLLVAGSEAERTSLRTAVQEASERYGLDAQAVEAAVAAAVAAPDREVILEVAARVSA